MIHFRFQKLHPKQLFFKRAFLRQKPATLEMHLLVIYQHKITAFFCKYSLEEGSHISQTLSSPTSAIEKTSPEPRNSINRGLVIQQLQLLRCDGAAGPRDRANAARSGVLSDYKTPSGTVSRSQLCNGGETAWKIIMRFNLIEKIFFTFGKVQVPTQPMTFKIYGGKSNSTDDHYINYPPRMQNNHRS